MERENGSGSHGDEELRLRPVRYPIATQALANWWKFDVKRRALAGAAVHYTFRFLGSTCTNSGAPIESLLNVVLRPREEGLVVERAWIEFDPEDEGHPRMCAYGERGKALLTELAQPASFCGLFLEDAIESLTTINPAGCFCQPAMVQHKWRQMLCAIHYGLSQSNPR